MNQDKKHRKILLLMVTSQALLTIFVFQWLRAQYSSEKENLHNRLTGIYLNTQDALIDTMLFRSYVSPVIGKNKIIIRGSHSLHSDTSDIDSVTISASGLPGNSVRWSGATSAITVKLKDGNADSGSLPDTIRIRKVNEDMLIRSVKMIVAHTSDSLGKSSPVTGSFTLNPDTSVFKENFQKTVEGSGMKLQMKWLIKDDTTGKNGQHKAIIITPFNPFSLPGVAVESYWKYLVISILPQILFGLILIIITAIAFAVSYRNIRDQAVLNNLRNEFVGNITHELKTPVATLSVALESLGRYNMKNEPERMEEYLKLATLETKRLENLITRILDNSLLGSDRQILDIKEINLNTLIREVEEETAQTLGDKGSIKIIFNEDHITVQGDSLFLKGVLLNLIDNSIRYCNRKPEIIIILGKEGNKAMICVNDNGPGIPEEYHKKIFEKFFRLPSSNVHNVKGYGLGLSYVYQVLKLHNGSVEVQNLDKGCSFTIRIPLSL